MGKLTDRSSGTGVLAGAVLLLATPAATLATQHESRGFAEFDPSRLKGLTEIIVSAEKRENNLQKTPIAVTAFDEEALAARLIDDVNDIAAFVPNVSRTSGPTGGPEAYFFIRGVGQVDNNPALDPGVGVYLDEVYLGRTQGGAFDLVDIERIEVLRGPQGTLFGRNTIGGAVNVISQDPDSEGEVHGRITAGERNLRSLYVSGSVPLSDDTGLRISALTRQQDGWSRNVYTGEKFGEEDTKGFRLKLVANPEGATEFALAADYTRSEGSPIPVRLVDFNLMAGPTPGQSALGVPFPGDIAGERSNNRLVNFASSPAINDIDSGGISGTLRWAIGDLTVKSITAYRMVDQLAYNDFDAGGYSFYDSMTTLDQSQLSQEFQLAGLSLDDRLDWLVGLYYFKEDIDHFTRICLGTNEGSGNNTPAVRLDGRCLSNNQALEIGIDSYALFAHTNYSFDEQWSLVLGARYTREEKDQLYDISLDNTDGVRTASGFPAKGVVLNTTGPNSPIPLPFQFNEDWSEITPRVGLNFQYTEDVLFYASYSTGFKSGGFSGRPVRTGFDPNNPEPIATYDPEETETLELGFKGEYFDNRLRVNAAIFHSEYDDIQLLVVNPLTGSVDTLNAGDAEIDGAELEIAARPIPALNLSLGVGFLDNEYTRVDPNADNVELSDELPLTPDWTINFGAQYDIPVGDGANVALRADVSYRGEVSYQVANEPADIEGGYAVTNFRATYTPNETWNVSAYLKNAFDKEYSTNALDSRDGLGPAFAYPNEPREAGVELGFQF